MAKVTLSYGDVEWSDFEKECTIVALRKAKYLADKRQSFVEQYEDEVNANISKKKKVITVEKRFSNWLKVNYIAKKESQLLLERYKVVKTLLEAGLKSMDLLFDIPLYQFDLLLDAPIEFLYLVVDHINQKEYQVFEPCRLKEMIADCYVRIHRNGEIVGKAIDAGKVQAGEGAKILEYWDGIIFEQDAIEYGENKVKETLDGEIEEGEIVELIQSLKLLGNIDKKFEETSKVHGEENLGGLLKELKTNAHLSCFNRILNQLDKMGKNMEKVLDLKQKLNEEMDDLYTSTTQVDEKARQVYKKLENTISPNKIKFPTELGQLTLLLEF